MITPASERSAQSGLPSQSCARPPRPIVCSDVLSAPWSVSSWPKSTPTTVTGSMYGMNTATRWKRQPRMPSNSRIAIRQRDRDDDRERQQQAQVVAERRAEERVVHRDPEVVEADRLAVAVGRLLEHAIDAVAVHEQRSRRQRGRDPQERLPRSARRRERPLAAAPAGPVARMLRYCWFAAHFLKLVIRSGSIVRIRAMSSPVVCGRLLRRRLAGEHQLHAAEVGLRVEIGRDEVLEVRERRSAT